MHGKLIRGNAGKDDRPGADRACPPRCPDRFADRIKRERKWIGLRSILGFLTFDFQDFASSSSRDDTKKKKIGEIVIGLKFRKF